MAGGPESEAIPMNPCPNCGNELDVFYSDSAQECICVCQNIQCELCRREVTGVGDRTQEAVDHFNGLALRFDTNPASRKAKA